MLQIRKVCFVILMLTFSTTSFADSRCVKAIKKGSTDVLYNGLWDLQDYHKEDIDLLKKTASEDEPASILIEHFEEQLKTEWKNIKSAIETMNGGKDWQQVEADHYAATKSAYWPQNKQVMNSINKLIASFDAFLNVGIIFRRNIVSEVNPNYDSQPVIKCLSFAEQKLIQIYKDVAAPDGTIYDSRIYRMEAFIDIADRLAQNIVEAMPDFNRMSKIAHQNKNVVISADRMKQLRAAKKGMQLIRGELKAMLNDKANHDDLTLTGLANQQVQTRTISTRNNLIGMVSYAPTISALEDFSLVETNDDHADHALFKASYIMMATDALNQILTGPYFEFEELK